MREFAKHHRLVYGDERFHQTKEKKLGPANKEITSNILGRYDIEVITSLTLVKQLV